MNHNVNPVIKKRAIHRAKIIEGQIKGLMKAIEAEAYCPDLLNQSLSVQRSLKSLDALLLENHLQSHVVHQMHESSHKKAVAELLEVFNAARKS